MASLDVDSLFTNIPLDETIEIVTKKVFAKKNKVNGLSRTDFRRLLALSTKGTAFLFDGSYYRQKDGVAMGSPLGPVLANAFLCHYETKWLDECPLSFLSSKGWSGHGIPIGASAGQRLPVPLRNEMA